MTAAIPDRRSSCASTLSLLVAVPLYLLSLLMISGMGTGDSLSRGLSSAFAAISQFLLWLPLGAFVALSCAKGGISGRMMGGVAAALVLAALACLWAIGEMDRPDWAASAPALLPVLALAFGLWASRQSGGFRRLPTIGFAAAALALMAVPLIHYLIWTPIREREYARWDAEQAEQERRTAAEAREKEARFRRLGPQSRLDDYLPFLDIEEQHSQEAIAGASALPSRQADAERLVAGSTPLDQLEPLHQLGLQASPALCEAYRRRIGRLSAEISAANPEWGSVLNLVRNHLPNLRWFIAQGCDLRPEVRRMRGLAGPLAGQYGWEDLLQELDQVLGTPTAAG
ncbi:MAG TPA: hypothetical protein VF704_09820 [Allosphingosinicella sp.]